MGYILAALVYQFVYPIVRHQTDATWRVILWAGILPALLVFWIMPKVKESPIWLERQRLLREKQQRHVEPFGRLFTGDLLPITIQTTLLAASFLFMYNSIAVFYPTFLINGGWQTVPFALAFNASAIVGNLIFGRLSETGLGRRGAAALATVIGALSIPLYLFTPSGALLMAGAAIMGFFGTGNFGVVPGYLNERFPTAARASGAGFSYQAGAAVASFAPAFIGFLHDSGMTLPSAMAVCIAAGSLLVLLFLWLGPETRGREFQAHT
jgi:SHS family lactate transporter-like MFS transporter